MEHIERLRRALSRSQISKFGWTISSVLFVAALTILLVDLLATRSHHIDLSSMLLGIVLATLSVVLFFLSRFLLILREPHYQTSKVFDTTEREFQSVFENALDTILILDHLGICQKANPAVEQLFGFPRFELIGKPLSRFYKCPSEFQESWNRLLVLKYHHFQAELWRGDGSTIFVEFSAKAEFLPGKHVVIIRDITRRREAEQVVARHLALAQSAWTEADALRKAALELTQDLRLDYVLDSLLQCLLEVVPYESAQVLHLEADFRLSVARMAPSHDERSVLKCPLAFDAAAFPLLQRILVSQNSLLLSDTKDNAEWVSLRGDPDVCSWLCVPLIASHQTLGLLSLSHRMPDRFTKEHLRVAKLLAIPAAAAIQNARLYDRAEIYGKELQRRLFDLREAQSALQQVEKDSKFSN